MSSLVILILNSNLRIIRCNRNHYTAIKTTVDETELRHLLVSYMCTNCTIVISINVLLVQIFLCYYMQCKPKSADPENFKNVRLQRQL